jgi:hypothetical protein
MKVLRTSSSRLLGIVLVITCAVLFLVAFVTGFLVFEVASVVSFILGVALLAVELEPRVRISVAADTALGYLRTLDNALSLLNASGKATYSGRGGSIAMVIPGTGASPWVELPPVGDGLYAEVSDQVGDLNNQGYEFFRMWVPRALADDLSMAEAVGVSRAEDKVDVSMKKPFVRPLCVDPFVNSRVCCRMGCPLAGAVAQSLAAATRREVQFENCVYDPKTQRAVTSLTLGKRE